jgi:hypothetical protein
MIQNALRPLVSFQKGFHAMKQVLVRAAGALKKLSALVSRLDFDRGQK